MTKEVLLMRWRQHNRCQTYGGAAKKNFGGSRDFVQIMARFDPIPSLVNIYQIDVCLGTLHLMKYTAHNWRAGAIS